MAAVRRAHLPQPGTALRHHVGDAERATDLDQLAARHEHVAVGGERVEREQHGGGVVVHHQPGLGARERAQILRDERVPVAPLAGEEVDLQVGRVPCRGDDRRDRLLGERGPAEVRVQHDTGRVHDAPEPRRRRRLEPGRGASEETLVGRHRRAARRGAARVLQDETDHLDDVLAPPARDQRGTCRRLDEPRHRRDRPPRVLA
jgi:hypothetical protein